MTSTQRHRLPRRSRTYALIAAGAAVAVIIGFTILNFGGTSVFRFAAKDRPAKSESPFPTADVTSSSSTVVQPLPPPLPLPSTRPDASITIAAVGDMNPSGNTSGSSASGKNAAAITSGLADGSLTAFLALGDLQYPQGTCSTLVNQWGRLWGPAIEKTYHIAGPTHDAAGPTEELGYRKFFNGECPGSTAKSAAVRQKGSSIGPFDAYSFDLASWHFAMMPTAALRYDTQSAASLARWLDEDLSAAENAGRHLVVAYHDPYFTSTTSAHSRETKVRPWIDVIDRHRVRLTLSGSQHNYERSCPVRTDDTCTADDGRGTTAFQVSTGGIGLRSFTDSPSYIVKRFSDTHGWLKLTLNADGSFSWLFKPVDGSGTDSGSRTRPSGP